MIDENKKQTATVNSDEVIGRITKKDSGAGPFIGSIIIIIIIILGGWYYLSSVTSDLNSNQEDTNNVVEEVPAEVSTSTLSESDEIEDLEADLDTTELDSLDAELEAIEAEIDAELEDL